MIRAGELKDRVVFQKPGEGGENAFGEPAAGWATHASARAKVLYGKGIERRAAAIEGVDQPATFLVRATAKTRAVNVKDRIVFDGSIWDITNSTPSGSTDIELTATRRA